MVQLPPTLRGEAMSDTLNFVAVAGWAQAMMLWILIENR